ncbi:GNAT family N-acetyltransferase [bacterium]|nr:GNAT family N-acetyltransferase [bacterium]
MQINSDKNYIYFSSLRCPIKPFRIKTSKGYLYCSEIDYNKDYPDKFYKKIGKFYLDIFANTSSHPFWKKCRKPNLNREVYDDYINSSIESYKQYFQNPDTTVLLVHNNKKQLVGALYSRSLELSKTLTDNDTLYIDSLAIKQEYRGNDVGKKILNKILNTSKERFAEVFLVAYKESVRFYEKLHFSKMSKNESSQTFAISELAKERIDYPDYVDFMQINLKEQSSDRWYNRIKNNK